MNIYSISDLHLDSKVNKPMDKFGPHWTGYWEKIQKDWKEKVQKDDVVVIAGDISWAINLDQAIEDLSQINALPGKKVLIRGNHDYWWSSYNKVKQLNFESMFFLQNNAVKIDNYVFFGSRGWDVNESHTDDLEEYQKLLSREEIRLKLSIDTALKLKKEGDILIGMMHYPPYALGFNETNFTKLFNEYDVNKVIYGHLHNMESSYKGIIQINNTEFILTSCDYLQYNLIKIY